MYRDAQVAIAMYIERGKLYWAVLNRIKFLIRALEEEKEEPGWWLCRPEKGDLELMLPESAFQEPADEPSDQANNRYN